MAELKLPELGENIETVDVSAVLVAVGDEVARDQPVIEVETEKASLEVPSIFEGRVKELKVSKGDKVRVGQVLLVVDGEPLETAATPAPTARSDPRPERSQPRVQPEAAPAAAAPARRASRPAEIGYTVPAAPSVRALARELGVAVEEVPGSARGGRITRDDVKAHAKRLITGALPASPGKAPGELPLPDFTRWGEIRRQPLGALDRAMASRMARSWTQVPHVTQFDRAEITQLESLRRGFNARDDAARHKLTVTAVVIKLVAEALREFPRFNASLDLATDSVVLKDYVNIGVAVDTERGLLVPALRNVDRKRLIRIVDELDDLAQRARAKKLRPEEMEGATFTVSNLGGLGTTYFSPIVNWPEVAILGIGRAERQAIPDNNEFRPGLILPLSLSYDHRWIDGAGAARFLRWVAEALEQPFRLLLDGSDPQDDSPEAGS